MNEERLNQLVQETESLHGAAICESDGVVLAQSNDFDADVPCAIAAIGGGQLVELGELLAAGKLEDWCVVTGGASVYVSAVGERLAVAVGEHTDRPAKVAERLRTFARPRRQPPPVPSRKPG